MGYEGIGSERTSSEVIQRSKRLWAAVIHQAIEDAKGNVSSVEDAEKCVSGIQHEALRWIFYDLSNTANSFNSICDFLDIDPDLARQRLRLMPGIRRGLNRTRLDDGKGEGDPC